MAGLAGPPARAVHAAVAQLCQDGLISVDARKWQVSFVAPGEVASRPPIEQSVLRTVAGNTDVPFSTVEAACAPALADLQSSLRTKGLLPPAERARPAWLIPCLMVFAVQLLGLIRFFVGLSRHKPVGLLVISWLAFGVISSLVLGKRPYRTRRGDRLLASLKANTPKCCSGEAARDLAGAGVTVAGLFASMALPLAVGRAWLFRARRHAGRRHVPAHAGHGRRATGGEAAASDSSSGTAAGVTAAAAVADAAAAGTESARHGVTRKSRDAANAGLPARPAWYCGGPAMASSSSLRIWCNARFQRRGHATACARARRATS